MFQPLEGHLQGVELILFSTVSYFYCVTNIITH